MKSSILYLLIILFSNYANAEVEMNGASIVNLRSSNDFSIDGECISDDGDVTLTISSEFLRTVPCISDKWTATFSTIFKYLPNGNHLITANQSVHEISRKSIVVDLTRPEVTIEQAPTVTLQNISSYITSGTCSDDGALIKLGDRASTVCNNGLWSATFSLKSELGELQEAVRYGSGMSIQITITDKHGNSSIIVRKSAVINLN